MRTAAPPNPRAFHTHVFISEPLRGAKAYGAAAWEVLPLAAAQKRAKTRATPSRPQTRLKSLDAHLKSTQIIHLRCVRRRGASVKRRGIHLCRAHPSSPCAAPLHPPTRSPTRAAPLNPIRHRATPADALLDPPPSPRRRPPLHTLCRSLSLPAQQSIVPRLSTASTRFLRLSRWWPTAPRTLAILPTTRSSPNTTRT